jgi:hypothetical protein
MTALRRRIRAVACAWLFCQVASLSAFVPAECCKAHAAEAAAKAKAAACHESAPVDTPKEGDACPMHRGSKSHDCCTISNACDGPGQPLTTLFAYVGVVQTPQSAPIVIESTAAHIAPTPPLLHHLSIPDAPPPRLTLA